MERIKDTYTKTHSCCPGPRWDSHCKKPASFGRSGSSERAFKSATTPSVRPFWHHSALRTVARERERACTSDGCRRAAPAHEGPRNGSNNSVHESTSGHSTNYGSGHLIRVFRDIGCIFSLRLLLGHSPPIGRPLRKE